LVPFTADLSWKLDCPMSNSLKFGDERNPKRPERSAIKNHEMFKTEHFDDSASDHRRTLLV
jgi:hypothetical protein